MSMSFLYSKQLKILKTTNVLELVPVKTVEYEVSAEGRVSLIIPRFRNTLLIKMFTGERIGRNFRFMLDETGSQVWLNIEGTKNIETILNETREYFELRGIPFENAEERIAAFFNRLYREDCVSFKQLVKSE
jgi:hypothetical protein